MNLQQSALKRTEFIKLRTSYDELQSPISISRNHANKLFITERNIGNNISEIEHNHNQLNDYIATLELKVNERMEKNDAEILIAYKNHISLVKKDMEDLRKEKQSQANSSNSYVETIQYLEKKLSIFRDQSLKLFQKLDRKEKEFETFKMDMSEIINENAYMTESVKGLKKEMKELEIENMQLKAKLKHEEGNEEYAQKYDVSQLHSASFKNKYYRHKNKRSILTSANLSKAISSHTNVPIPTQFYQFDKEETGASNLELFSKKLRLKLNYLDSQLLKEVIRVAEDTYCQIQRKAGSRTETIDRDRGGTRTRMEKTTRLSMRSRSNYSATADYHDNASVSNTQSKKEDLYLRRQCHKFNSKQEMSGYFVKCVQTIKKEITRKKELSSLNFYKEGNPISSEQFKRLDCHKLMELVLANQRVLEGLYNLLLQQK